MSLYPDWLLIGTGETRTVFVTSLDFEVIDDPLELAFGEESVSMELDSALTIEFFPTELVLEVR